MKDLVNKKVILLGFKKERDKILWEF